MTIRWSARARSDIREVQKYIAKDSPYYARQFIGKIFGAIEKLIDHPKIGRQVPEAERDDVRELIFQGYRIIYAIKRDSVYIVTVVHGSRDMTRTDIKPWDVL